MADEKQKTVEKYYIEVGSTKRQRFFIGLLGGLGWGIGLTLGTALVLGILGLIVSKIDLVPIIGHFSAEVIKSAQTNLKIR